MNGLKPFCHVLLVTNVRQSTTAGINKLFIWVLIIELLTFENLDSADEKYFLKIRDPIHLDRNRINGDVIIWIPNSIAGNPFSLQTFRNQSFCFINKQFKKCIHFTFSLHRSMLLNINAGVMFLPTFCGYLAIPKLRNVFVSLCWNVFQTF